MRFSVLFLGCAALASVAALAGCTVPEMAATGATVYFTKPSEPPPADTADQIPEHASWCYRTAGYPECYSHPQDVPPERLINVDPASQYPQDIEAYRALVAKKVAARPETVVTPPPPPLPPVVTPVIAAPLPPQKPVPQHHVGKRGHVKKTHKKHRVKAGTPPLAAPPGHMPISLQPSASAPPDAAQTEKNDLQNEIGKGAAPAPAPSGDALPGNGENQ